jgi:hypothetical protein
MIYNESTVQKVYEANFREGQRQLQSLPVFCGYEPNFPGLSDWIFEQTIQHCIRRELEAINLDADMEEQVVYGTAIIDLLVGNAAIDIKTGRSFSAKDTTECVNNQTEAKKRNWRYIFLKLYENNFQFGISDALGNDNTVFLQNGNGEWERFIGIIATSL